MEKPISFAAQNVRLNLTKILRVHTQEQVRNFAVNIRHAGRKCDDSIVEGKLALMKLVLIEWVDSHGSIEGWKLIEENSKSETLICESVGWLLYDGKDCKTVLPHKAGHKSDNIMFQGRGELTIPTKAIIRMKTLNVRNNGR
ncbi:MAG TPA: hypothetical protein VHO84_01680 [Syntrophorhabdaceae bacterium]|nr:hypothetical protein [Syntrophorhabdaceae bacterium]